MEDETAVSKSSWISLDDEIGNLDLVYFVYFPPVFYEMKLISLFLNFQDSTEHNLIHPKFVIFSNDLHIPQLKHFSHCSCVQETKTPSVKIVFING